VGASMALCQRIAVECESGGEGGVCTTPQDIGIGSLKT